MLPSLGLFPLLWMWIMLIWTLMPKDEVLSLLSVLWNMPGISKQFRVHDLFLMVLGIELRISCMQAGALSSRAEPYVLFLIVGWPHSKVLRGCPWVCAQGFLLAVLRRLSTVAGIWDGLGSMWGMHFSSYAISPGPTSCETSVCLSQ